MSLRAPAALWFTACLAAAQSPPCQAVEGDRILARDLAAAVPAFSRMPAEVELGYAPVPGAKRILHAAEVASLAERHGIRLDAPRDVCFEWAMEPLQRERVVEAMRAALQLPEARIEIAEMSLYEVPRGRVEFARSRLGRPAAADFQTPALWRGDVVYGGRRRYGIWVRVRIAVPCKRAYAVDGLKSGAPIEAGAVRVEDGECFPSPAQMSLSRDSIAGMMLVRPVAAGAEIRADLLTRPNDVNRGDSIDIEVRSGAARLAFIGRAESAGRSGDTVAVRNPDSNKLFQARVIGKGKAIVQADGARGK